MTWHLESGALKELSLTTNGSQLEKFAGDLVACGVKRINVSLDALDENKFAVITRWGRLLQVLAGIRAAQKVGLWLKINTVALKYFNEDKLFTLAHWCAEEGMDLTFIEVMPMGDLGNEGLIGQYWSLKDLRIQLETRFTTTDLSEQTGGSARYVRINETSQKIDFITPMTHNFCKSCNRVRLTYIGELYMCLGQESMEDLRKTMRDHTDDIMLQQVIRRKPKGHDFDYSRQKVDGHVIRHMSHASG